MSKHVCMAFSWVIYKTEMTCFVTREERKARGGGGRIEGGVWLADKGSYSEM